MCLCPLAARESDRHAKQSSRTLDRHLLVCAGLRHVRLGLGFSSGRDFRQPRFDQRAPVSSLNSNRPLGNTVGKKIFQITINQQNHNVTMK